MKRQIKLVIYRALGFRPGDFMQTVDAIESAWSFDKPEPFKGTDPISFGFEWESGITPTSHDLTKFWNGLVRNLNRRKFVNPDGAIFQPGGMSLLPHEKGQSYYRGYLTFERL